MFKHHQRTINKTFSNLDSSIVVNIYWIKIFGIYQI
jgi:hypothetical protein